MEEETRPASPAHPLPVPVNDEFADRRKRIKAKCKTLQKYIHFEASVRPHLDRLASDIVAFGTAADEQFQQMNDMRAEMAKPAQGPSPPTDEEREEKIAKIRQLETIYSNLLREKAFYLSRASEVPGQIPEPVVSEVA
jgi:hypothetical protein